MLCTSDKRYYGRDIFSALSNLIVSLQLPQFMQSLQHWKIWDSITKVQNYQLIKDYL
jgi:hypothetical protein